MAMRWVEGRASNPAKKTTASRRTTKKTTTKRKSPAKKSTTTKRKSPAKKTTTPTTKSSTTTTKRESATKNTRGGKVTTTKTTRTTTTRTPNPKGKQMKILGVQVQELATDSALAFGGGMVAGYVVDALDQYVFEPLALDGPLLGAGKAIGAAATILLGHKASKAAGKINLMPAFYAIAGAMGASGASDFGLMQGMGAQGIFPAGQMGASRVPITSRAELARMQGMGATFTGQSMLPGGNSAARTDHDYMQGLHAPSM